MNELAIAYIEYLANLKGLKLPKMPKFNTSAYTDNEYLNAIDALMRDYDKVDDVRVTENFIKGDYGS